MSDAEATHKAVTTTPNEREIHVERYFEAPRDRVFDAYTNPELIPQWWGPYGTTTIVEELDAKTGGFWRFVSRDADGSEIVFRGVFREVSPPQRISQTFEWDGVPGYVSVDTSEFEDLGDRTKVTSTSIFYTTEERDGMIESGMEKGMNETFNRLDELLAKQAA
jgi:uncharacterized protein YndB with AHSA1/START domain